MIDRCSIDPATPELATHFIYDPNCEDFETLELSPEEDAKLTRAAQFGPNAVKRALAGDPSGLEDMRRLHITRYEVRR